MSVPMTSIHLLFITTPLEVTYQAFDSSSRFAYNSLIDK